MSAARLPPRCCASIAAHRHRERQADGEGQQPDAREDRRCAIDAAHAVDAKARRRGLMRRRRPRSTERPAAIPSTSRPISWRRRVPSAERLGVVRVVHVEQQDARRIHLRREPGAPRSYDIQFQRSFPSQCSVICSPLSNVTSTSTGKVASPYRRTTTVVRKWPPSRTVCSSCTP